MELILISQISDSSDDESQTFATKKKTITLASIQEHDSDNDKEYKDVSISFMIITAVGCPLLNIDLHHRFPRRPILACLHYVVYSTEPGGCLVMKPLSMNCR